MARRTVGSILIYAAVAASVIALAVPATAVTLEGATDDAWDIVNEANLKNQRILDEFTAKALSAETQEELLQHRAQARSALDAVYAKALADLDALAQAVGGDADWVIALAKEALKSDHEAAEREVDDLTAALLPTLPPGSTTTSTTTTTKPSTTSTTTTTKPSTTSTTATTTTKPTATTTTDGTVTTTTAPVTTTTRATTTTTLGQTTTTTLGQTTTTTLGQTTTTTEGNASGGAGGSGDEGSGGATGDDPALAAPPVIGDAATLEGAASDRAQEMREDRSMLSSMLASSASVALPPAVVTAGTAPFIVLEVLFGTLFESLAALVFPFLMLVIAVSVLIWRETKRPTIAPRF